MGALFSCFKGCTHLLDLYGFEWFWSSWGCRRGGGPLLLPRMRKVRADSSKTEGTPPGGVILGSLFGLQMWHILMVFTMRSRDPKGGQKVVLLGSYLR